MTPRLSRAARALLGWTQPGLAKAAGVGLTAVVDYEREHRELSPRLLRDIRAAFEKAGIEFINGTRPGVRLIAQ